jgi:NitT/TauT family transport system ATP-binding protein
MQYPTLSNGLASGAASDKVAALTVTGLRVTFGKGKSAVTPFSNVSFNVLQGEFICIIGSSGAGKSTLLFSLAGLTRPSEGEIRVGDRVVHGPGRDCAVVFQDDAVFPWYTVEKNVGYGPRVSGWSPDSRETAVEQSLRLVGLSEYRKFLPHQLSGGMRKRVDVARAFAANPDNILMDEPFGGLDTMTKESLQEAILHIWEATGKTIIFVTHDLEEAAFLADRVFVLRKGGGLEIVAIDLPRPRTSQMRTEPALQNYRRRLGEMIRGQEGPVSGQ